MGLNPMRNSFVKLAAEKFGKPEINVIGDSSKYKDWDNVMWAWTTCWITGKNWEALPMYLDISPHKWILLFR